MINSVYIILGIVTASMLWALWKVHVKSVRAAEAQAKLDARDAELGKIKAERDGHLQSNRDLQTTIAAMTSEVAALNEKLLAEKRLTEEKLKLLEDAKRALSDAFKGLASDALNSNNENFLKMAKDKLGEEKSAIGNLVTPVNETLDKLKHQVDTLEGKREEAYKGVKEQIDGLISIGQNWQREASALSQAIRTPRVRGRWGELQLRRLVELAGMQDHVDFFEQQTTEGNEGKLRPDMLIHMPNDRIIVVDSKVPFDSYFAAIEAVDEGEKSALLDQHVRAVRGHLSSLSTKKYSSQFANSPDFTVMFMNLESAFSAALVADASLLEDQVNAGVVIATPTTLLALLKAVAYGWEHDTLTKSAEEIKRIGMEMYERLVTFLEHYKGLGGNLNAAIDNYNKATGSFESRVLISARRFRELGLKELKELPEVNSIDRMARLPVSTQLPGSQGSDGSSSQDSLVS